MGGFNIRGRGLLVKGEVLLPQGVAASLWTIEHLVVLLSPSGLDSV